MRIEQQTTYYSPSERAGEHPYSFPLTVLFTDVTGTLKALRKAAQLAYQLGARIQILVPYVVPYALPLNKPNVDPEFRLRQFHTYCEQEPINTQIDIRLCRDAKQCIQDALLPHSLIVIGCRRSWWPLSHEKRLAKCLTNLGHHVVLVHDNEAQ